MKGRAWGLPDGASGLRIVPRYYFYPKFKCNLHLFSILREALNCTECIPSSYYFSHTDTSFTMPLRTQFSSQYLPVHMTLVSCYSSNVSLINCTYHEFNSTTRPVPFSTDISISCGSQQQCVPVTTSESVCDAMFFQFYYIPVDGQEESETFAIVAEISDQLNPFCSNALLIFACFFIHPPCDPIRGT